MTIILAAAADSVSLTTIGTAPIDVTASWIDQGPGSPIAPILPNGQNTLFRSATTAVIAPGPTAGVRNLKTLTIVNKDPAAPNTIVVTRTIGGVTATMTPGLGGQFVLPAGYELQWTDENNWRLLDETGAFVSASVGKSPIAISAAGSSVSIGTIVFSDSNNVSFGMVGSTITATVIGAIASINLSAGTTSNLASAFTFANSNGISFGLDASTITASVASSLTNINVSAGTTSNNLSAITFANSNGISFGLNGSVLTASVASGLSNINVSAGTTSNNLSAVTFSNANNVSFGLNGSVVTASAVLGLQTVTAFSQDADFVTNFVAGQGSLSLQKLSLALNLQATQLAIIADFNGQSTGSGAVTISHGVYTLSGETARLASSASRVISWASGSATSASSQYGGVSGTRYRTIDVSYGMTPGDYIFAWWIQTTGAVTCTIFGRAALNLVGSFDGIETNYFLNGLSTGAVAAFPSSIVATDTGYVRTGFSALRQPGVILIGTH